MSRNVWGSSRSATASAKSPRSDRFVMGRPPSPATTSYTVVGVPDRASRTFWPTIPPTPMANAFSRTTTRLAPARAVRTSSSG